MTIIESIINKSKRKIVISTEAARSGDIYLDRFSFAEHSVVLDCTALRSK